MTDFDEKLDRLTDYSGIDQKIENDKKPELANAETRINTGFLESPQDPFTAAADDFMSFYDDCCKAFVKDARTDQWLKAHNISFVTAALARI